jgi:hypothetical protein
MITNDLFSGDYVAKFLQPIFIIDITYRIYLIAGQSLPNEQGQD